MTVIVTVIVIVVVTEPGSTTGTRVGTRTKIGIEIRIVTIIGIGSVIGIVIGIGNVTRTGFVIGIVTVIVIVVVTEPGSTTGTGPILRWCALGATSPCGDTTDAGQFGWDTGKWGIVDCLRYTLACSCLKKSGNLRG